LPVGAPLGNALRVALWTLALASALLVVAAQPARAERGLTTGFLDDVYGSADDVAGPWLDRTVGAGVGLIRINVGWAGIAPTERSAGFDPADPAAVGYNWEALDAIVRRIHARGLQVMLCVLRAPTWAQGRGRPRSAAAGSWRPDPRELSRFAAALAKRYSGEFGDLPRVRNFMLWNEPNLESYLAPQWSRKAGRLRPDAPVQYRKMLLAFAPAIKAVHSDNRVIAGATSPYGDPDPGESRMQPARFVREMLCINHSGCARLRFDVLSHHPYSVGSPRRKALNRDDVAIPDLGKLTRLLRTARRTNRIVGNPKLWVTEVSYDSRPPDPDGVPAQRHARWLEETLYLLWKQGASAVVWLQIRDSAPHPSYAASYQSGIYLRDGRPKPAARAFRFPFVIDGARAWGKSPASGRMVIERRTGNRWTRVTSFAARRGGVFLRRVRPIRGASWRARVGDDVSVVWR
jgi:hypothetical protein